MHERVKHAWNTSGSSPFYGVRWIMNYIEKNCHKRKMTIVGNVLSSVFRFSETEKPKLHINKKIKKIRWSSYQLSLCQNPLFFFGTTGTLNMASTSFVEPTKASRALQFESPASMSPRWKTRPRLYLPSTVSQYRSTALKNIRIIVVTTWRYTQGASFCHHC